MDTREKRKLAEKVVDLTVMNRARATATVNNKPDPEMTEKLKLRMREEQTELYVKHFDSDQLLALLDFYTTEMGKSILESQKRVSGDISSGMRIVSGDASAGAPGKPFSQNFPHQNPDNRRQEDGDT